ncbi:transporter [Aromatoleum petrolei]|uniref:Transporter n=1 Tax=Aromatoleum petrolei TaxID=76116 RepID=A0ABX1MRM5_9RHOO|nr:transporter [Aromatoleum petrolei]NMF87777.1 transporter [Aromatoleum petrolei]QTQ38268.1 MetA-pathway phenol degradation-like protein [Aromatoleum petrolei]
MSQFTLAAPKKTSLAILAAMAALCGPIAPAQAQTTFDVIGPHEYELPVGFKPFNVFVQYAYVQRNNKAFDDDGDRVKGSGANTTVGLSKYVRFWTPESNPSIGLAYEVIVPEIGVKDRSTSSQVSGIGDPLTGFAIWYKPTPSSTLGFQSFVQIPVGNDSVSDSNWKNLSSLLWDVRLTDKLGWTADAGFVFQNEKKDGSRPGTTFHTNHRLGYRVNGLLEPFVAVDYERSRKSSTVDSSHALDAGVGLMFHTFDNQSITLRYSKSIEGENHSFNNSVNLKYAYVW